MNEEIQWDPSIIKKYGSSNHLKLLTQLKSELITYPLKRKNNNISKNHKENIEKDSSITNSENTTVIDESLKNNQQSNSLFKSKHNSIKTSNNKELDTAKANISNATQSKSQSTIDQSRVSKVDFNNNY